MYPVLIHSELGHYLLDTEKLELIVETRNCSVDFPLTVPSEGSPNPCRM